MGQVQPRMHGYATGASTACKFTNNKWIQDSKLATKTKMVNSKEQKKAYNTESIVVSLSEDLESQH